MKYLIWKLIVLSIRTFFYFHDRFFYYCFYQFKQKVKVILPNKNYLMNDNYEVLAIFSIYQPKSLSLLIKRSINHLFNHKIKVMVVAPHSISQNDIQFLKERHCIVLTRLNFGRDFGSYKYGILYLLENKNLLKTFKKVILLNDGIFFPLKENDSTLATILNNPHDVIGLAENYQQHWHIGSYFILFKIDFLFNKPIQDFWREYKPYCSRFHAIKNGEIALGKKIILLMDSCKIIYSGKNLLNALEKSFFEKKIDVNHFIQLISKNIPAKKNFLLNELFLSKNYINLAIIGNYIENLSPVHIFSLALIEYLDCFFIKRDICYRGLYSISQVLNFIAAINQDEKLLAALNLDLRNKGLITSMPFLKKILCASGAL